VKKEIPMTLREFIVLQGFNGTPEQIAEALNAKSIPITNSELYTSTGIILALGPDLARSIIDKFEAAMVHDPLLRAQYDKLNSTGIDFSHPFTQQMIDDLKAAGIFTTEEAEALKRIGVRYISPYEQFAGEGSVVTAEDVAQAMSPQPVTGKRLELKIIFDLNGSFFAITEYALSGTSIVDKTDWVSVNGAPAPDPGKQQFLNRLVAILTEYISNIE